MATTLPVEIPEAPTINEIALAAHQLAVERGEWTDPEAAIARKLRTTGIKLVNLSGRRVHRAILGAALASALLALADVAEQSGVDFEACVMERHRAHLNGRKPNQKAQTVHGLKVVPKRSHS